MRISDWSSDVCSSDLQLSQYHQLRRLPEQPRPVDRTAPGVRYRQLGPQQIAFCLGVMPDIIAPRGRSEEHTSELQSLMRISYAVFCLTKNKSHKTTTTIKC